MKNFTRLHILLFLLLGGFTAKAQFSESFDGTDTPAGWTVINLGDDNTWEFGVPPDGTPYSGSGDAYISWGSTAHDDYLITPQISVTTETSDQLRFYARNNGNSFIDRFDLLLSTTGNEVIDFTDTLENQIGPPGEWTEYIYNLSDFAGQNIYIAFRATSTNEFRLHLDDVFIEGTPTCPKPSELTTSAIASTSAVISWTENGTATEWEVTYGVSGFDPATEGVTVTDDDGTPGTILTDLTPDTNYEFYVRAICGVDDESILSDMGAFYTGYCEYTGTNTSYYIDDFSTTLGIDNISNLGTGDAPTGYANYTDQTVSQSAAGSVDFAASFSSGTYGFNIFIDWNNNMIFEDSEKVYGSGSFVSTATGTITVPLGMANGDYRMRIVSSYNSTNPAACGDHSTGEAEDYTFSVIDPPSCLPPTDLVVDGLSSVSADVSWTENGTATEWEITYGEAGFDPTTEGLTVTDDDGTPGIILIDLLPDTEYDFYVRAICSADDESSLSAPGSLYTGYCSSVPTSNDNDGITNVTVGPTDFPGTDVTYLDFTGSPVDLSSGETANVQITFGTGYSYGTNIWVDFNDNLEFESSELVFQGESAGDNPTTLNASFSMPIDVPLGVHRMRIGTADSGQSTPSPCYDGSYGVTVDLDINITEAPACVSPSDLMVDALTSSQATVGWTENGTATEWEIIYGEAGFDPATEGTTVTDDDGTPGTILIDLTPNTNYEFYVRAICGADDESNLSVAGSFFTGYCEYTGTNTSNYIDDFSTTGGTENISNLGTGDEPTGYGDYTDLVVSQFATGSIDFTANFGGGTYGFNVYIDWNNNMVFDADEKVYASGSYVDPATGTITVPEGTANGDYRMRITADYYSSDPAACGDHSTGEAEDYTFSVIDPPSCLPPTFLVVEAVSTTSADISWTENGTASEWEVTYGISGFDPATEGSTVTDDDGTPGITLIDLIPATEYDFYVRAICSADDESSQAGPASFLTECVAVTEFFENFDSTATSVYPACWDQVGTDGDINIQASNPNSPPNSLYMYAYNEDAPAVVKTIPVSNLGDGTHQLSFNMRANFTVGGVVQVGYLTDPSDASTFVSLESVTASTLTYDPYIVIPEAGTYTENLALRMTGVPANSILIDDVSWEVIPTCAKPTFLIVESVGLDAADVNWTENGTAIEWEVLYGEAGFDPATEGTTLTDNDGTPGMTIPGLDENTQYDFYVRAICGTDDNSDWAGPKSFTTLCGPTDVPYIQDFESATPPALPSCTTKENAGSGNDWNTASQNGSGFDGIVLKYVWDGSDDANAWFYTQGINMVAGTDYQISYKYGNNSDSYIEKMKVSYGTDPQVSAMVTDLADYPNITGGNASTDVVDFTVDADGVYYFGFNVYSDANQYNLYLDTIVIDVAAVVGCDAPTDVAVTNIDMTSATASWTETSTATDGYTVEVFATGADPDTDTPVFDETVGAGTTTSNITGLEAGTTYDAYVTSNCGALETMSEAVTFTTSPDGINELDAYGLTYYPNPVKNILNLTADMQIEDISVYNLLGKKVIQIKPESVTVSMDMSNLASGSYLVKVTINDSVLTYKLMKN